MESLGGERQDTLKRRWPELKVAAVDGNPQEYHRALASPSSCLYGRSNGGRPFQSRISGGGDEYDDNLQVQVSSSVPAVTVVLEGRSICQRINLDKHSSYQSLANALRQMFVDCADHATSGSLNNSDNDHDHDLDLSNAVPGHLIAYEDMENDLLLVGDLNWKDFVRVAKRIRILPVKANSRKRRGGGA